MEKLNALLGSAKVCRRRGKLALGIVLGLSPLVGWAASAIDLDGLLQRPWLRLDMPGLVLVSDASEGQLRDWARQIDTFQRALAVTLQIPPGGPETTATLFLFKSDSALKPLLPRAADGKPLRRAAMAFFGTQLGHDAGAVSFSGSRLDARERLQHELTHWHLRRSPVRVPLWLNEGLAQIYEAFVMDRAKIRLGQDRDYVRDYVRISENPPLGSLLGTEELDYSRAGFAHQRTDLFYAQSWALTHYLLFAVDRGGISGVTRYLQALQRGATQERAFPQAFGVSVAEAHAGLEVHIRTPRWRIYEMPLARADSSGGAVAPIAGADLEARLATLLAIAGHRDAADELATRLLARQPEDAVAWEVVAMARREAQQLGSPTISALAEALRRGTRNPHVPLLLGYASIETSLRDETGCDASELFARALALRPGMPEAYEGAARLALESGSPPPRLEALVVEGVRLFPASVNLVLAAAWVDHAAGRDERAVARLVTLLDGPAELSPEFRLQATRFLNDCRAKLPPPVPSSAGKARAAS